MLCPRCGSETPKWVGRCENCGIALIETKSVVDRKGPYRLGDVAAERYEVRDRISTGPLYWSYVAFDQEDEKHVVLRAIRRTILPRSRDHRAFVSSMEPVLLREFPTVARTLRIEREEGQTLVVGDFIDGLPLNILIQNRRQENRAFSAVETLAVLVKVAEALESMAPFTSHGDLRPHHILIFDSTLVVEAIGIAAALPKEETIRALKDAPEASGYLPPEVRQGRLGDPRSDVYSLAMIAGELLSGRIPPAQGVGFEDFFRHLPPLANDVIRKFLNSDIEQRDATPSELVSALTDVLGAHTWKRTNSQISPAAASEIQNIDHEKQYYAEDTQRTSSSAVEDALVGIEYDDSSIEKDPRAAVEPAAEGTQQITTDMIESMDDEEPLPPVDATVVEPNPMSESLERDPRILVQPELGGTQRITPDMIEIINDSSLLRSIERNIKKTAQSGDTVKKLARAIDLDPRLVRAARQLDRKRDNKTVQASTPNQLILISDGPDSEELTDPAFSAQEVTDPSISPLELTDPALSSQEVTDPAFSAEEVTDPAFSSQDVTDPAFSAQEVTNRAYLSPNEESSLTFTQSSNTAQLHEIDQEINNDREAVSNESDHGFPQQQSLIHPSVADTSATQVTGSGRTTTTKKNNKENPPIEDLPAVVVDASLTDAFRNAKQPTEVTHKVRRYEALQHPTGHNTETQYQASPFTITDIWKWLMICALISGSLLFAVLFWLWIVREF